MAVLGAYRCIECNGEATELYRDYQRGVLRISICSIMTLGCIPNKESIPPFLKAAQLM